MEAQPKCNLIIDSCCDLPFEVIDCPGVQLLEFPYIDEKGRAIATICIAPSRRMSSTRGMREVRSRLRRRYR